MQRVTKNYLNLKLVLDWESNINMSYLINKKCTAA